MYVFISFNVTRLDILSRMAHWPVEPLPNGILARGTSPERHIGPWNLSLDRANENYIIPVKKSRPSPLINAIAHVVHQSFTTLGLIIMI